MNVSFALASLSRNAGGLFDVGRRLAQELAAQPNTRVRAVGFRDEFTDVDEVIGPRFMGFAKGYQEALRAQHPDIVHQHGIWTLGSVETHQFTRRNHIPLVISVHGMLNPWSLNHSKWKKRAAWLTYQRKILNDAGCILVNAKPEAEFVRQRQLRAPIAVVPNGVDLPEAASKGPPWRSKLAPERRVLLFLGRIHPIKGVFELVRGWAQFVSRYPDRARNWSLVVTGWDDGGHEARLRALANELGLQAPTFLMTGPAFGVERDAALAHADGFVLPSHSEGMPLAALEAMAAGLPLLLTKACNLPDVFAANAGVALSPSADGICDGIVHFAALTPDQRQAMRQHARDLARDKYAWSKIAADTRRIYDWLLKRGPKPDDLLV
jgi:glycosyltransferase involved in cell wall biosynthesis